MKVLNTFAAIRERKATRRFSQKEVPDKVLTGLLSLANRAPSGFNLQPWHFIIVRDPHIKRLLRHVAMNQAQVEEAPATVVFVADPKAWKKPYTEVLSKSVKTGALSKARAKYYRKNINLLFSNGPFDAIGLIKKVAFPFMRLKKPIPNIITDTGQAKQYVAAQTMLAASTL